MTAELARPTIRPLSTNQPLPIECLKCHHDGCLLVVTSMTVVTLTCASCRHTWATDIASMRHDIQKRIDEVLGDH